MTLCQFHIHIPRKREVRKYHRGRPYDQLVWACKCGKNSKRLKWGKIEADHIRNPT